MVHNIVVPFFASSSKDFTTTSAIKESNPLVGSSQKTTGGLRISSVAKLQKVYSANLTIIIYYISAKAVGNDPRMILQESMVFREDSTKFDANPAKTFHFTPRNGL